MIKANIKLGDRFGKLVVKERLKRALWLCLCDCGNSYKCHTSQLINENRKSCGCLSNQSSNFSLNVSPHHALHQRIYHTAIRRGLTFTLTEEDVLLLCQKNCVYCGIAPYRTIKPKGHPTGMLYNGIDRVDSSIGYELDNCVPCCWDCNRAKSNRDEKEFLAWLDRIAAYRMG